MRIIITGGGTAGHVNPGIAIVKYYKKRHPDTEILFVGTENGIEKKLVESEKFEFRSIEAKGLHRDFSLKGIFENIKISKNALKSAKEATSIIEDWKPDIVIGCGGYASFPVMWSAQKLNVKTIVLEVNIFAGITTKILSKKADKILLAFSQTRNYLDKKTLEKVVVSGSPTREDFRIMDKKIAKKSLGLPDKPFVVSFWGSTGALYMNQKMVEFINHKDASFEHIHATGKNSYEWFVESLVEHNSSNVVEYIYNMPKVMAAADLVICRGGAATISEICIMGKPAIIVPSPYVAENHQEENARTIEKAGGCVVMLEEDIKGRDILRQCQKMLEDKELLETMSVKISKLANLSSNELIYNEIRNLQND
ncbi:MAG: undecaprenyldiphospho-muramoylpentapeptide beta-N-acetylglucosaminyltransferase [Clostridia bacterium]